MNKMKKGFTLVEIMIVVAIIAILAAIAIPNFIAYRTEAQENSCTSTQSQIRTAAESWLSKPANAAATSVAMTDIAGEGKYMKDTPTCPGGGTYTIAIENGAVKVTCSKHTTTTQTEQSNP